MKKGLTETIFILDRSGSMGSLTDDTIGGYNSMLEQQKNDPGETNITTVLFNSNYQILHNCVDVNKVEPMTRLDYMACGTTALLDAVGMTIDLVGQRLANTPEDERPEKVIFVITTDGKENASREYTKTMVKEKIEHQQNVYNWTFMFLGANIDAVGEAQSLGINTRFAREYTASPRGTESLYSAVADTISYSKAVSTEAYASGDWTEMAACCLDSIV
jgi:uncharacterized protein YegL